MNEKSILVRPTSGYAVIMNLHYLLIIPFLIFGLSLLPQFSSFIIGGATILFLMALYSYFMIRKTKYEITKAQLKYSRGIFTLTTDFLEHYRVKDIVQQQPFILRLIGVMNVVIQSTDKTHPVLVIRGIPLSNIADTIRDLVEHSRKLNRVFEVD